MFDRPGEGAKKLAETFNGILTPAQMQEIDVLVKTGREVEAQGKLFDAFGSKIDGFRVSHLTPLQQGLENIRDAFIKFRYAMSHDDYDWTGKAPASPGLSPDRTAAAAAQEHQNQLNDALRKGLSLEDSMGLAVSRRQKLEERIADLKHAQTAALELQQPAEAAKLGAGIEEAQRQLAQIHEKGYSAGQAARRKEQREIEQAAKEERDLGTLSEEANRQHAAAVYDIKRQEIEGKRQLGLISAEEELQQLQKLKQDEYQIQLGALEAEYRLMEAKPIEQQKINNRILALQDKLRLDMQRMQHQMALESKKTWDGILNPIGQSFKSAVRGMIQGTTTLRQAVASVGAGMVGSFADAGMKMAGKWIEDHVLMAAYNAIFGKEQVADAATTATATAALAATQGLAVISAHAAEAGAAAFASTAAIPVVGPGLAPEAAAAAYSATMAFGASLAVPSAAGGWEVPKDTLAMVHENEMILPAPLSDKIRNMTEPGGGSGEVHLHVHAIDAASVHKLFLNNGAAIAAAMKQQARNFNPNTRPS